MKETQEDPSTEQPSQSSVAITSLPVENPQDAVSNVKSKEPTQILGIGTPGWWGTAVLCLFISIASSSVTMWVYDRRYATKIVAFDLKGYVEGKAADFAVGKISQEETSIAILQLGYFMKNIPPNTAVISADVAVRNIETIKP